MRTPRTTNFQWQEILFPLVTRVVVEGSSRSGGMGKETAWLENVQRLAGSCLDRGFGGNGTGRAGERAWRGRNGRRAAGKGRSEEDEEISRRSTLYPRDLKPNGGGGSLKKNGFTTCCWRSHLKIPLDIERISEKEGDAPVPVDTTPVPQYLVNIKVRISRRRSCRTEENKGETLASSSR